MEVMYKKGETRLITTIKNGQCVYTGKTIKELQAEYPGSEKMDFEDACHFIDKALEKKYSDSWEEIDHERYMFLLEALPPQHWHSGFFCLTEKTECNYTTVCGSFRGRYFEAIREANPRRYGEYKKEISKQFGLDARN